MVGSGCRSSRRGRRGPFARRLAHGCGLLVIATPDATVALHASGARGAFVRIAGGPQKWVRRPRVWRAQVPRFGL
jgi:hypothetical protein